MLRITLPLVTPGVLGATIFVFAEMLGSFSAALVLGLPARFYVITTAMYQLSAHIHHDFPRPRRWGSPCLSSCSPWSSSIGGSSRAGSYATITGKAFRPRPMHVGGPALDPVRRLRRLPVRRGDPAVPARLIRLAAEARHRASRGCRLDPGQLRDRRSPWTRCAPHCGTACSSGWAPRPSACCSWGCWPGSFIARACPAAA